MEDPKETAVRKRQEVEAQARRLITVAEDCRYPDNGKPQPKEPAQKEVASA